ncbi:MAG: hypothetical protein IJV44_08920 [Prevotella sp.]|nr:hypothetical protein [Prevotella sp.]
MKKVLFSIAIVAAGLFVASCGNKSAANGEGEDAAAVEREGTKLELCAKTYEGDSLMVSCDFWYPEDIQEIEVFGTFNARKTLADSTANAKIELYLQESSVFANHKEVAAKDHPENYKEFKIGQYDAYSYEGVRDMHICILFEHISETTDRFIDIQIDQIQSKSDLPSGKDFFDSEKGQKIINSLLYNGIVSRTIELE